jgi:hypothetical protein
MVLNVFCLGGFICCGKCAVDEGVRGEKEIFPKDGFLSEKVSQTSSRSYTNSLFFVYNWCKAGAVNF